MRLYANLIPNLALLDLPKYKYGHDQKNGLEKIFKRLLIYDTLPDDDFESVIAEVERSLGLADPAFEIFFRNDFEKQLHANNYLAKWRKIVKDYYYFSESETKRRNKENPYYNAKTNKIESWNALPDFSKQQLNLPYQFDHIYRDAQNLAGQIHELTKDYEKKHDKELFRAKVNSILVPDKIVFALNSGDGYQNFAEIEISVMNLKISLDSLKLAQTFLNRLVESLHKISWSAGHEKEQIDQAISQCDDLNLRLKTRIFDTESKFILYMDALRSGD